jgi:predicted Fe-S protein YdhL (DUF1289 family)
MAPDRRREILNRLDIWRRLSPSEKKEILKRGRTRKR